MTRGIEVMSRRNFKGALNTFDEILEIDPDFAKGWDKRTTIHYLMEEYESSLRDIERTQTLELRHFGALSGMGSIFIAVGNDGAALKAFEPALKVNPHIPFARARIVEIREQMQGSSF
ncbi:MAG: hypothetical protein QF619_13170 [Candidatus Binatia bacterium]|jgi:tetratricopeptide (TPR) repeat protein|nr:hypothetical protein [Candidatus Binatia bacterium]